MRVAGACQSHLLHLALEHVSGGGGGLLLLQLHQQPLIGGAVLLRLRNLRMSDDT